MAHSDNGPSTKEAWARFFSRERCEAVHTTIITRLVVVDSFAPNRTSFQDPILFICDAILSSILHFNDDWSTDISVFVHHSSFFAAMSSFDVCHGFIHRSPPSDQNTNWRPDSTPPTYQGRGNNYRSVQRNSDDVMAVSELPPRYHRLFSFDYFNKMQSGTK